MRGKVVNLTIGLIDILFGLAIGFFAYYIPQDITQVTVQEEQVKTYILFALYIALGIIILFNLIEWFAHKKDGEKYYGCILVFFSLLFLFFKDPAVAVLPFVGGIMIIDKTRKARLIESSSTGLISFFVLIATLIVMIGVAIFAYKQIGISIKDNENRNETPFKEDYFKYVTELDIESPYINVKKGGKYGYIDMEGNTVIDFNLDYASPFVNIVQYDKNFQIALVCQNGSTDIILKNGRKVMSYRSESNNENYEAKEKELEDLYKNTFGQVGPMTYEINKVTDNKIKLPVYEEDKQKLNKDYTYRYSYNDEYDILITESQLGLGNKYQLAKKEDLISEVILLLKVEGEYTEKIDEIIMQLASECIVKEFVKDDEPCVMLSKMYFMEQSIAQKIVRIKSEFNAEKLDLSAEIEEYEIKNKICN